MNNNNYGHKMPMIKYSDYNECAGRIHGCAQICHNTVGSYTCSCNNGYVLNHDGRGCDGKLHVCQCNSLDK